MCRLRAKHHSGYDNFLTMARVSYLYQRLPKVCCIAQIDLDRLRVQHGSDVEAADADITLLTLLGDRTPVEHHDLSGAFDFNDSLSPQDEFRKVGLENRPDLLAAVQFGGQSTHGSQTGRGKRHAADNMSGFENRARMTFEEAEKHLRNSQSAGIRYVVANEDGSFSIIGHNTSSESEKLEESFYDTVVVATNKTTTRPDDFVHRMQAVAAEPIALRKLIQHLIATYRPPYTKKNPAMVIRVRTRDAYMRLGYLRQVRFCSCEGFERFSSLMSGHALCGGPNASSGCNK